MACNNTCTTWGDAVLPGLVLEYRTCRLAFGDSASACKVKPSPLESLVWSTLPVSWPRMWKFLEECYRAVSCAALPHCVIKEITVKSHDSIIASFAAQGKAYCGIVIRVVIA